MSSSEDPSVIEQLLQRVEVVNKRAGFMAWDPEKLALDPRGDPGLGYPRLRPPTQDSPRLFISYGWSRDETHDTFESDVWTDAFAGFLVGRGYDIVFDRDPRNFHKGLSWLALLIRMNDCNYFVPVISDAYVERISSPNPLGIVPSGTSDGGEYRGCPRRPVSLGHGNSGDVPGGAGRRSWPSDATRATAPAGPAALAQVPAVLKRDEVYRTLVPYISPSGSASSSRRAPSGSRK